MLVEMTDRTDVHLIIPTLRDKVPLCESTVESIIASVLAGKSDVVLSYNDKKELNAFCIYHRFGQSDAYVHALYAPNMVIPGKREFVAYLRMNGINRLRWASRLNDMVWSVLTPSAKRLWSVWEWDMEEEHEGNNESGR